jgi:hypothetical protein
VRTSKDGPVVVKKTSSEEDISSKNPNQDKTLDNTEEL